LFHKANSCSNESKTSHCNKLNKLIFKALLEPDTVIIISDASIRNNVTTSITHIHLFNNPFKKILYHAISITSIEVKLFAIRCRINQAIQIPGSSHIIIITDIFYLAQKNFDSFMHPYQLQSILISKELRVFFNSHPDSSIEF